MAKNDFYEVEITSRFEEFWRYNIAITCALLDAGGNRTGFVAAERTVAPVGSALAEQPAGMTLPHGCSFRADDCDRLLMYLYLIPHTLPATERIDDCKPFEISVRATFAGKTLLDRRIAINQWGGASLEITVSKE